MGYEDAVTKSYFSRNEIFADAFNYLIYGGRQQIRSEELQEMDTNEIVLPFGTDHVKTPVQRYRDTLKTWTRNMVARTDKKAAYLILGLEEQTKQHYAMPVKDMLYDAMQYAKQVEQASKSYKEAYKSETKPDGMRLTREEFLSGFQKTDKLLPVITLVVYMGSDEWDAPMSIYEMFAEQDEQILKYVTDYRINLIAPAQMDEEDFDKFHTGLGAALQCIKHANDDSMNEIIRNSEKYKRIDKASADIINELTKSGYQYEEEGGYINMCRAVENDRRRAREEGKEIGREESLRQVAENMIRVHIPVTDIKTCTGFSLEKIKELSQKIGVSIVV